MPNYVESTGSCFVVKERSGGYHIRNVGCCGHGWIKELFRRYYRVAFNSKLSEEQIRSWLDILTLLFGIKFTLSKTTLVGPRLPYIITATLTKKHLMVHGAVRLVWSDSKLIEKVLECWKGDIENILLVIWGCTLKRSLGGFYGNHFFYFPRVPKETLEVIKEFKKLKPQKEKEEKINDFFCQPLNEKGNYNIIIQQRTARIDEYKKRFTEYKKT